jgi:hypothetical protein
MRAVLLSVLLLLAALAASASPVFLTEFKLTTSEADVTASVHAFLAAIGAPRLLANITVSPLPEPSP